MSERVDKLHEQMSQMALGDLLLVTGQAINLMQLPDNKIDMLLKYVEIAIVKRRIGLTKPEASDE